MILRDYQNDAVNSVFLGWQTMDRVAIEMAVGAGKTLVAAEVVKRTLAANPHAKIVTLAHRGELLRGMARTISRHCGIKVGIVDGQISKAMRKKNLECQVVCLNTATLGVSKSQRDNSGSRVAVVTEIHKLLGNVDVVILDEMHRANSDTCLDCLTELGCFNGTRLLGMTGTLYRQDEKLLSDIFEDCVYRKGILELIEEGWLVEPKMKKALVSGMDLTKVALSRSMSVEDFNATDLDRVMEESGAEGVIATFAQKYCSDRQTLVFTPTVKAAHRVTEALKAVGLGAVTVYGEMTAKARAEAFEDFEDGKIQFLTNAILITEGTDLPICSAIIMARPTKSKQLYTQIIGRSLRLADDKEDALIIDLVGATEINNLMSCDTLFGVIGSESVLEAKQRREHVAAVIQKKAALVYAALTPEEQEEVPLETIVSGSFNLFDVEIEETVSQVKSKAKESKEKKERERVKSLLSFPEVGRCGSLLELDLDFLVALSSWATLPQYKNSFAAGFCYKSKWWAFYCDSSKSKNDDRRYGFICEGVESFEQMELAIIEFTKIFAATKDAPYYSQNKLQPMHPKRKKQASTEQIRLMLNLLSRHKILTDEVAAYKNKELKQKISIGTCIDWLDLLFLGKEAREQLTHVKGWLRDKEK